MFAPHLAVAVLCASFIGLGATDEVANRYFVVPGTVHPSVKSATDRGPVEGSRIIHRASLTFGLSKSAQALLERTLEQQRDPASPNYQKWLTPEQFGERFGPGQNDLDRIAGWLRESGLTVDAVARGRGWIEFSGTAARIEEAFHTELHSYDLDGGSHFANASEVSVPVAFAGLITGVRGLHDFVPKRCPMRLHEVAAVGRKLAIAGQTTINLADASATRAYFHLATGNVRSVLYGAEPGIRSGEYLQTMLDLEWLESAARNTTILYVYSGDVSTAVAHAVDERVAPVISASYSRWADKLLLQQAKAEGITILD